MASGRRWLRWVAISVGICLVSSCARSPGPHSVTPPGLLARDACETLAAKVSDPPWGRDLSDAELQKAASKKVTWVDNSVSSAPAADGITTSPLTDSGTAAKDASQLLGLPSWPTLVFGALCGHCRQVALPRSVRATGTGRRRRREGTVSPEGTP